MDELVGTIKLFAGNFAPANYKDCDGSLLPLAENSVLFTILGANYGGDGLRTFALPDLRNKEPGGDGTPYRNKPRWIICVQGNYPQRARS